MWDWREVLWGAWIRRPRCRRGGRGHGARPRGRRRSRLPWRREVRKGSGDESRACGKSNQTVASRNAPLPFPPSFSPDGSHQLAGAQVAVLLCLRIEVAALVVALVVVPPQPESERSLPWKPYSSAGVRSKWERESNAAYRLERRGSAFRFSGWDAIISSLLAQRRRSLRRFGRGGRLKIAWRRFRLPTLPASRPAAYDR